MKRQGKNTGTKKGKRFPKIAIFLVIICTIFTSIGQLFMKMGVGTLKLTVLGIITDYVLIGGFISYAIGALILMYALKYGELSMIYPFISLSFIWVTILSFIFLSEKLVLIEGLGIAIIIAGVVLVGLGANNA